MSSLYQISSEIESICRAEELPPDLETRLDELALALTDKIDGCCRVFREFEAEAEKFKNEAKRMEEQAAIAASHAKRMKAYMYGALAKTGQRDMKTKLFKIWIQASPPSVQFDDSRPVPEGFRKVTVTLDRAKVLAAEKDGEELPDCIEITRGEHLRIR